jgi:hypothetical protein
MINIWKPKTDGHFINDFREKLSKKGFLEEDIDVIVENAKDATQIKIMKRLKLI